MSDAQLPDDLNQWPDNPYELLGVDRSVNPKDLRRAYTRLIRAWKPEQHPDHFRRIREAYEQVLRQVEFWQSIGGQQSAQEDEPEPAPPPWQQADSPADDLDALWQRACAGEEAAVYRRLVELQAQRPGQVDLCLRLYWLLLLTPDLEPRPPAEWLIEGLMRHGFTGPLREPYRREIADDPEEALSERFERLLQLPLAAHELADLAEWRWQAASRLGRWQVIEADYDTLNNRIDSDDGRLRLLIAAVEQLMPCGGDGARRFMLYLGQKLSGFEHLQTRLAHDLDRLEYLLAVAQGLHDLRRSMAAAPALLGVAALSVARPFQEVRPLCWTYLQMVVDDPQEALRELDAVGRTSTAVLGQIGAALAMLQSTLPDLPQLPEEELNQLRDQFVNDRPDAAAFRAGLLDFCLREGVAPNQIAEGLSFEIEVFRDWPLQHVWLGCRLFEA